MTKIAFAGGSNVMGSAFPEQAESPDIYPNLLAGQVGADVVNHAVAGASNSEIFLQSMQLLLQKPDVLCVEWNSFHRFRFYPAPNISVCISPAHVLMPEGKHLPLVSQKDLNFCRKLLVMLTHDYHEVVKLLEYCEIVQSMCSATGTQLVMLNGSVPWTQDLGQDHAHSNLVTVLSDFTKHMLDFDQRSDDEIRALLANIHSRFQLIQPAHWAGDPFLSMQQMKVDSAPLDHVHAGPATHKLVQRNLYQNLTDRNLF
jgi:hypothetical protein